MDTPKCQICSAAPCTLACGCTAKAVLLCPSCIGPHTMTPGNHHITMFRPVQLGQGNLICDVCTTVCAESICSCSTPVKKYCETCRVLHINKSPYEPHTLLPIKAWKFVQNREDFKGLVGEMRKIATAKQHLFANIRRIEEFKLAVVDMCRKSVREIEEFQDRIIAQTEEIREKAENEVKAICTELDEYIFDKSFVSDKKVVNIIRNRPGDTAENELSLFEFNLKAQNFTELLSCAITFKFSERFSKLEVPDFTFTLKGNKLVKYAISGLEKTEEALPFDTGANQSTAFLFHSSNSILGIGGDSSNRVWILDLTTKAIKNIASMSSIRRFPGVYICNEVLYVFGGHDGSKYLPSCEKLKLNTNSWEIFGPMLNARCGFNSVETRGLIFLIGGDGSAGKLEKYEIQQGRFTLINFTLAQSYFTTSFLVGKEIFIINSSYVYRLTAEENVIQMSNSDQNLHRWSHVNVCTADSVYYFWNQGSGPVELYRLTANPIATQKLLNISY